jgi:enamine deaminase RidA (YjgF/YER057c/UK114 family)
MPVTRVPSTSPYAPRIGFSAAVRAGEWVFVSGMTAVDARGDVVGADDPHAQAREALRKIEAALDAVGAGPADVVRTRVYVAAAEDADAVGRAHGEWFGAVPPAATMVVTGLLDPRMRVEIEAVAHVGDRPDPSALR